MNNTLVSVVIPAYRMGGLIGEALASVGAQTYAHWEVLVVDDAGPEDGTRAAVEVFAAGHPDHRVEYIRQAVNSGVSAARRRGLEESRGEFVAFLDADDCFLPEKLASHVRLLEEHASCVLCHGSVLEIGDWPAGMAGPREWFRVAEEGKPCRREPMELLRANPICNSTVVVRKAMVRPEDFISRLHFQFEDLFLWMQLCERGPFVFQPVPLTAYRFHPGSFTAQILKDEGVLWLSRLELLLALFPRTAGCKQRWGLACGMVESVCRLMGVRSGTVNLVRRPGSKLRRSLAAAALGGEAMKLLRFGKTGPRS